jgi:hypothetical protein
VAVWRVEGGAVMLWTVTAALLLLWTLGLVSSATMGGFIHVLLAAAIAMVLVRVVQLRRPVEGP